MKIGNMKIFISILREIKQRNKITIVITIKSIMRLTRPVSSPTHILCTCVF